MTPGWGWRGWGDQQPETRQTRSETELLSQFPVQTQCSALYSLTCNIQGEPGGGFPRRLGWRQNAGGSPGPPPLAAHSNARDNFPRTCASALQIPLQSRSGSGATPRDVTSAIPLAGQSEGRASGKPRAAAAARARARGAPRGYINMAGGAAPASVRRACGSLRGFRGPVGF